MFERGGLLYSINIEQVAILAPLNFPGASQYHRSREVLSPPHLAAATRTQDHWKYAFYLIVSAVSNTNFRDHSLW